MATAALHIDCDSCGAALDLEPHLRTTTCPYCASPQVVERPPRPGRPQPTFCVGFVVQREAALAAARRWKRRYRLWAPRSFNRAAVSEIRGVYLPVYIYSAVARSRWAASIGETYTVQRGKHRETRTEWRELEGDWAGYVRERLVTASRGVGNEQLEAVEPFETGALLRFTPALVSGWIAEEPSLPSERCLELGRSEARAEVAERLAAFLPGDRHRDLRHVTRLENEDVELTLLPVWVLPVAHDPERPPVRLLVNGQTGACAGRPPVSAAKVALAIGAGIALLGAIAATVRWLLVSA